MGTGKGRPLLISRVICIKRSFAQWRSGPGPFMHIFLFSLSTALNRTIQNLAARGQTIDDYNYENKEIGEIILEEIGDTKFDGISVSACLT